MQFNSILLSYYLTPILFIYSPVSTKKVKFNRDYFEMYSGRMKKEGESGKGKVFVMRYCNISIDKHTQPREEKKGVEVTARD